MKPESLPHRVEGKRLSRRVFLKQGAGGAAALVVGFYLGTSAFGQNQQLPAPNPFNAWVKIDSKGQVALFAPLPELGEGLTTSVPMLLAEELDVDWNSVRVVRSDFHPEWYGDQSVGGSGGVQGSWLPVRQAGAATRSMLVAAAANIWSVDPETCRTESGAVYHGPRTKRLTYGELVETAAKLPVPDLNRVPLKNPANFRLVGLSVPRSDIPEKVDGRGKFGMDVRVPGMLYAVVARCPVFEGKIRTFDATKAKAVPGVRQVVEIPAIGPAAFTAGGISVIAESTWAALQGRRALAIEWDLGPGANFDSMTLRKQFGELSLHPGKPIRDDGDADTALAGAAKKVEAVYELPFLCHAPMEPMNCTVYIRPESAEVWVPTQAPAWNRDVVAHIAGLPPHKVTVHPMLAGGGFGRRYQADFAAEAAQVAKVAGAPVMLVWTREDDMQHDFYRPASYHRMSGGLDASGRLAAWRHRMVSTSIRAFWNPQAKPEAQEIGVAGYIPYLVPNYRVEYAHPSNRVPVAWWRSVEESINGFTVESFIDELAAAAGVDPAEYRLRLMGTTPRRLPNPLWPASSPLDTSRLRRVLELALEKAGWNKPVAAGRARGVACCYSFDTYVAEVAEVSVLRDGTPRIHRITCVVDCGRVVNPDGVKAQMEGGIVYALSAALTGEITIEKGAVKQANFDSYPVLRMSQMPAIDVFLAPSDADPSGVGEPGVPPLAPAVTNAIFAATGKRIRRLPIGSADLKQT
jgi:isoquinoline 1-oxidoreductase beta subunit